MVKDLIGNAINPIDDNNGKKYWCNKINLNYKGLTRGGGDQALVVKTTRSFNCHLP